MAIKHFYFVRHGETNGNLHRYVPGKDEPLNDHGFLQASQVAERTLNIDFDKLYTSDFLRAQQTGTYIAESRKMELEALSAFGEVIEPSSLWGMSEESDEVQMHRKNRNSNVENQEWRQEDGENYSDIFARVQSAKKILEENTSNNILVASHSFFMQLFAAAILLNISKPTHDWFQVAVTLKISNTGVTLFTFDDETNVWNLVTWNDHAHFAE